MLPMVPETSEHRFTVSRRDLLRFAALGLAASATRAYNSPMVASAGCYVPGSPGFCIFCDRLYFNGEGSDHVYLPPRASRSAEALSRLTDTEIRMKLPYI